MGFGPSTTLSTLRPELAAFLDFDLAADRAGYIGAMVAPIMDVALQSDNPGRIRLADLLPDLDGDSTKRAAGSNYSRGKFDFEKFTYATEEHGHEETIDDRDRRRYRHLIDAEAVAVQRALTYVLGNYERRVADLLFNTTTWTGASLTTAVSNEWDDFTNATPVDDVLDAVQKVYSISGLDANAMWINKTVFQNLQQCDQIQDVLASSGAGESYKVGNVTAQKLAEVLGLQFVFVAGGSRNNANPGQTPSPTRLWSGEYAMVGKVATSNDIREPCVARTFHWDEDGSSVGGTVEQYREEGVRGDVYRVRFDSDEVVMYKEAAHLLSNITT